MFNRNSLKGSFLSAVFLSLLTSCNDGEDNKTKKEKIEKEIEVLKHQYHALEMKEMKENVEGQEMMIADWQAFAKNVEQIRQDEEVKKEMQAKIKHLEEEKAHLLQK